MTTHAERRVWKAKAEEFIASGPDLYIVITDSGEKSEAEKLVIGRL